MRLFDLSHFVVQITISCAYRIEPWSRSLPQAYVASQGTISQLNPSRSEQGVPTHQVYPTRCFSSADSPGPRFLSDLNGVRQDCFYIINEVLPRLHGLLSQDLPFSYSSYKDENNRTYRSRWTHGSCVINVGATGRLKKQSLRLSNVVLSGNKILEECLIDRNDSPGGTTQIGDSKSSFYVRLVVVVPENTAILSGLLNTAQLPSKFVRPRTLPPMSSLPLDNGLRSGTSQLDANDMFAAYPMYPTNCYSPRPGFPLDPDVVIRDCYFIINEILFKLPDIGEELHFVGYHFRDRQGKWHSTRWKHRNCAVTVGNANIFETTNLELLNVILAANKIVVECLEQQRIPQGGTVPIGSLSQRFFVGILGYHELVRTGSANQSTSPLSLDHEVPKRSVPPHLSLETADISAPDSTALNVNASVVVPGPTVHPVTCSPPIMRTDSRPNPSSAAMVADCSYILNEIILRIAYIFEPLTFTHSEYRDPQGYRHQSCWEHGMCIISVNSIKARGFQTLRLLEVALTANKILAECVNGTKDTQDGGTSPVGPPETSLFVTLMGSVPDESQSDIGIEVGNNYTPPFPPNFSVARGISSQQQNSPSISGTLSVSNPKSTPLSLISLASDIKAPTEYPVNCFNPYSTKLPPAVIGDCEVIINELILRYPNLMTPQTFGYTPSVDVDLALPQNAKWAYGDCVMFVRNKDKTRTDTFRIVDIAVGAHKIMNKCLVESKYRLGGTVGVGTANKNFFIGVCGVI